jgi:hypothetical protein
MNIDSTSRFIFKLAQVPRASIAGHSPDALYKKSTSAESGQMKKEDNQTESLINYSHVMLYLLYCPNLII